MNLKRILNRVTGRPSIVPPSYVAFPSDNPSDHRGAKKGRASSSVRRFTRDHQTRCIDPGVARRARSPTSDITRRAYTGMSRSPTQHSPHFNLRTKRRRRQQATVARRGSRDEAFRERTRPAGRPPCGDRRATRKPEHRAPPARHRPAVSARHTRTRPGIGACRFRRAPTSFPGFGSTKTPIFIQYLYSSSQSTPDYTRTKLPTRHAMPP